MQSVLEERMSNYALLSDVLVRAKVPRLLTLTTSFNAIYAVCEASWAELSSVMGLDALDGT